ncbi:hypothetical protein F2Q68_00022020 [Brassica cretica]|uniref:Uncharacterized protein n=1 Tax=Brassica cretica TaxID=69181 RepID=A0A8S9G8T8_BRACR|nr:hypothetical protein F2Q68_00022020 [Brassica cretica]
MSRPSSPASRPAPRSCSPDELAHVMVELAGRSVSAIRGVRRNRLSASCGVWPDRPLPSP